MNERQMTLGQDYAGEDLSGWFLSEKFDGCRAYWDGAQPMKTAKANGAAKSAKSSTRNLKLECQLAFYDLPAGYFFNSLLVAPGPNTNAPHRYAKLFLADTDQADGKSFALSQFAKGEIKRVSLLEALAWYVRSNGVATCSGGNPDTLCAMAADALAK